MNQIEKRKGGNRRHIKNAFVNLSGSLGHKRYCDTVGVILDYMGIEEPDGLDKNDVPAAVRTCGVMKREVSLESEWYRNASVPILAELRDGGYAAVLPGVNGAGYAYFENGRFIKVTKKNGVLFKEKAYYLYRGLDEEITSPSGLFKFALKSVNRGGLLTAAIVSLALTFLGLVTPEITRRIFDFVIPSGTESDIPAIAALFFWYYCVGFVFGTDSRVGIA